MDVAAASHRKPGASDLLLEHCFALDLGGAPDAEQGRSAAVARLEALLGAEMARRLLLALSGTR